MQKAENSFQRWTAGLVMLLALMGPGGTAPATEVSAARAAVGSTPGQDGGDKGLNQPARKEPAVVGVVDGCGDQEAVTAEPDEEAIQEESLGEAEAGQDEPVPTRKEPEKSAAPEDAPPARQPNRIRLKSLGSNVLEKWQGRVPTGIPYKTSSPPPGKQMEDAGEKSAE